MDQWSMRIRTSDFSSTVHLCLKPFSPSGVLDMCSYKCAYDCVYFAGFCWHHSLCQHCRCLIGESAKLCMTRWPTGSRKSYNVWSVSTGTGSVKLISIIYRYKYLIPYKIVSLLSSNLKPAVLPFLQTFFKRVFQNTTKVLRYNRFGGDSDAEYLPFRAILIWGNSRKWQRTVSGG
jgi:hypothetical protein